MGPDERAIRDAQTAWFDATARGDLPKLLSLMADDVVFLTPGRPPFGREEFATSFKASLQQVRIRGRAEFEEIVVVGEMAYTRARLWVEMTPIADGKTKWLDGYALSVFRKLPDGRWVLARDANLMSPISESA